MERIAMKRIRPRLWKYFATGMVFLSATFFGSSRMFAQNCIHPSIAIVVSVANGQKAFLGDADTLSDSKQGIYGTIFVRNVSYRIVDIDVAGLSFVDAFITNKIRVWSNEAKLVEVTDIGRNIETHEGTPVTFHEERETLFPGDISTEKFVVDFAYRILHPGSYSIQVERPDPTNRSCMVVSNTATFTVAE